MGWKTGWEFVSDLRKQPLTSLPPWPDKSSRAYGRDYMLAMRARLTLAIQLLYESRYSCPDVQFEEITRTIAALREPP